MLHSRLISSALIAAIISLSAQQASSAFVVTSNSSARKLPSSHSNVSPERNTNDAGALVPVPPSQDSPTASPSVSPILFPTSTPTVSPTASPTVSPTTLPTVSPTKGACASNGDGSFGGTSGSEVSVTYNFEMVTAANGSASDALKNLEASIANLILSSTLECDVENRRNLKIGLAQRKRHLEIAGLSSKPDDVVTANQCTISTSNEICSVVEGKMTLYVSNNGETYETAVLDEIKRGMGTDGELVSSDDSITELIFFTPATGAIVPPANQTSENNGDGNAPKANGSLSVAGSVAGAVCAFIIAGFFTGRRMMTKKEDGDIDDAEGTDVEAINLNEPSFDTNNQSGLHSILNSSGSVSMSSP